MRLLDPATYSEWWSEKFRRGQYGLRMESHRVASTTDRLGLATLPPLPIGYEVWNTVVEVNHEFVVTAPGGRWNFPTPWTTGRRYDFYQQPATVHAESTRVRKFRRFWDPDKKRLTHDLAATDSSSWAARLWPGDALDSFGSVVSMRQVADWNEDSRLKAGLRLLSSPSPVCGDSIRVKLEFDSATPLSTDGYVRWTVYALDFEPTTARLPERERPWVRHGWERGQTYLQRRAKIEGAGTTFVFRTTGEEGNLSSPPILCTGTELNRIYEVRAYVQDGTGRTASLRLRIPVLDGNGSISAAELAPAQMHAPDRLLTLETEDLTLDGAELLNVSLRSALEDPLVLLELDGPLASHRRVLRLASGAAEVQLPITPGTRPRAIVRARTVHGFQLHHDSQLVDIPDPRLFLTVSAVFTQDAYSPGDKALLRIRCVDLLGRPVSIPLTVTVCGVVPDSGPDPAWSDPRRAFHGIESSAMGRSWIPRTGCLPASEFVTKATVQTRAGLESRDSAIRIREGYSRPRLPRLPALPTTPFDASRGLQPGSNSATIPKFNPNYVPSKTAGTPFWSTELHTDANGNLEVEVKLDRANTRWIAAVMAMDEETRTGLGTAVTTTRPE